MTHATDLLAITPTLSSICSSLLRLADQFGLLLSIHITEHQSQTFSWSNGLADRQQSLIQATLHITVWSTRKEMGQATTLHLTESAAVAAFHQARISLALNENGWRTFQQFCRCEKQLPPPTSMEQLGEYRDWHLFISKMGLEHKRFFREKMPYKLQSQIIMQQEKQLLCRSDGSIYQSQFWRVTLQATFQSNSQTRPIHYQDGATFFEIWHPGMNEIIIDFYEQMANRLSICHVQFQPSHIINRIHTTLALSSCEVSTPLWIDTEIFAVLLHLFLQQPPELRQSLPSASRLRLSHLEGHICYQPFHSIGTLYPSVTLRGDSVLDMEKQEALRGAHLLFSLPTLICKDGLPTSSIHIHDKAPSYIMSGYHQLYQSKSMDSYFLLARNSFDLTTLQQVQPNWLRGRLSMIFSSIICGWGTNRTVIEPHSLDFCVTAPSYLLIDIG
ncbi:hypothetical protein EEL30_24740 [Brevibacillus laterosporus]|uniref:Uncharacterized protein n=1 Tax=Brevibacillus laterosporus TaxID=1465 RepID=A0A518VDZ7_BRELA|nr:hypothetical protein EEL30_24740 [Brevibacillus laterosporus]